MYIYITYLVMPQQKTEGVSTICAEQNKLVIHSHINSATEGFIHTDIKQSAVIIREIILHVNNIILLFFL